MFGGKIESSFLVAFLLNNAHGFDNRSIWILGSWRVFDALLKKEGGSEETRTSGVLLHRTDCWFDSSLMQILMRVVT